MTDLTPEVTNAFLAARRGAGYTLWLSPRALARRSCEECGDEEVETVHDRRQVAPAVCAAPDRHEVGLPELVGRSDVEGSTLALGMWPWSAQPETPEPKQALHALAIHAVTEAAELGVQAAVAVSDMAPRQDHQRILDTDSVRGDDHVVAEPTANRSWRRPHDGLTKATLLVEARLTSRAREIWQVGYSLPTTNFLPVSTRYLTSTAAKLLPECRRSWSPDPACAQGLRSPAPAPAPSSA